MSSQIPHRRYNLLTDEWFLVSPHRTQRPWQGQIEKLPDEHLPEYDPTCYLCPGNKRAGDKQNPDYTETFVFENDFPALLTDIDPNTPLETGSPLLVKQVERGFCRVICFTPRHDLTLARMSVETIRRVVDVWAEQTLDLAHYDWLHYVQIFESRGAIMGASNPHPHGQLWANERVPQFVEKEDRMQRLHYAKHGRTLLSDVLADEMRLNERIVWQNDSWVVLVPFWAFWPFETLLISRRPVPFVHDLTDDERTGLAEALSAITIRYDNVFETSFPYGMGVHQAPVNTPNIEHWHLHLHFFPPLLRSATVRKFVASYELFASLQRDSNPESAAERLRSLSGVHYRDQQS